MVGLIAIKPAYAAADVFLDSDPGDYIGGGATQHFRNGGNTTIRGNRSGSNAISVSVNSTTASYSLSFATDRPFVPGTYARATRYPFNSGNTNGLDVSGNGRGCNELDGWFEVIEFQYNSTNNKITKLALDFVQHCEHFAPGLYGSIRINSDVPAPRTLPAAIAGVDQQATEKLRVTLDGSQSFSRGSAITYSWIQTAGPVVVLSDSSQASPFFRAPAVPSGGEMLSFELTVTNSAGQSSRDQVDVLVHDKRDPQTRTLFNSQPGDYIGGGRRLSFSPPDWTISAQARGDNAVAVNMGGPSFWSLEFAAPANQGLVPGKYPAAMRYPFQAATSPGLSISGDGRGCNQVGGWFDVIEVTYKPDNSIDRLAIDFEQFCENGSAGLIGAVRVNSRIPVERAAPEAIAGEDQEVNESDAVTLNGRQSIDRRGAPITYHWTQTVGTPIVLVDAETATPRFVAPAVRPNGGEAFEFQLTVGNAKGRSDTDRVRVQVDSRSDPQTYIHMVSDGGDYIGGGRETTLGPRDGISISRNYAAGVSLDTGAPHYWTYDFASASNTPLTVGAYENAQRFPFKEAGHPVKRPQIFESIESRG